MCGILFAMLLVLTSANQKMCDTYPEWHDWPKSKFVEEYDVTRGDMFLGKYGERQFKDLHTILTTAIMKFTKFVYERDYLGSNEPYDHGSFMMEVLSRNYSEELTEILDKNGEYLIVNVIMDEEIITSANHTEAEQRIWDFVRNTNI